MNFLGGLKKGWKIGDDKLGPVGGLLGAIGGGAMGLFDAGGSAPAAGGALSLGDKLGNIGASLGAAQNFIDGDWQDGATLLKGRKKPTQGLPTLPAMPSILKSPITGAPRIAPPIDEIDTQLWRRRNRGY